MINSPPPLQKKNRHALGHVEILRVFYNTGWNSILSFFLLKNLRTEFLVRIEFGALEMILIWHLESVLKAIRKVLSFKKWMMVCWIGCRELWFSPWTKCLYLFSSRELYTSLVSTNMMNICVMLFDLTFFTKLIFQTDLNWKVCQNSF